MQVYMGLLQFCHSGEDVSGHPEAGAGCSVGTQSEKIGSDRPAIPAVFNVTPN